MSTLRKSFDSQVAEDIERQKRVKALNEQLEKMIKALQGAAVKEDDPTDGAQIDPNSSRKQNEFLLEWDSFQKIVHSMTARPADITKMETVTSGFMSYVMDGLPKAIKAYKTTLQTLNKQSQDMLTDYADLSETHEYKQMVVQDKLLSSRYESLVTLEQSISPLFEAMQTFRKNFGNTFNNRMMI